MYQNSLGIMPNLLNTNPILSVPNAAGVPNVNTASNVPKMTNKDPSVPKNHLVYQLQYSVQTGVPNVSVPKCTKCTKIQ